MEEKLNNNIETNTAEFAKQIMSNASLATSLKAEAKLKVLSRSCQDLEKLASIEPSLGDAAIFAQTHIKCQILMLKCLSGKFWTNGKAHVMQSAILSDHINDLFKLCLQLENKFINLKPHMKKHIKGENEIISFHFK